MKLLKILPFIVLVLMLIACTQKKESTMSNDIQSRVNAYADVQVSVNMDNLTDRQQNVVKELLQAAHLADEIFWHQSSHDALDIRAQYADKPGAVQEYIEINYGPYDRIHDQKRFIGEGPAMKPKGAGFYPADMSRDEFEQYLSEHPDEADALQSLYTVVKREDNKLAAIPYHQAYSEQIKDLCAHLRAAADYADNPTLKKYLQLRARALETDDYYASDLAWMELKDNAIDIVIGPIENYEDAMFNYKAAFESAVMIKDAAASSELDRYKSILDDLEHNLPIDKKYQKTSAGSGNVLEVVNVAYFGGDYQAGIKTIAASLPNDERVISEKGGKKQLYKNIIEAKFDNILIPIAKTLTIDEQLPLISREAFVSQVLLHELSHTLGPDYVYGSDQSVRRALKEKYSIIEECKADVLGIYHLDFLKKPFGLSSDDLQKNYVTYIAGLIRSVRFGYKEAHGAANLIQLNYLEKEGVLTMENGKYRVDFEAFHPAITMLASKLLMIEALGDYEGANELIAELGQASPSLIASIEKLSDVPRDLDLHFQNN